MKSEGIFRQKSIERIQSPENLNEYVRVTNPGVWLLLIGMAVLLVGAIVWGVFGRLETVVKLDAQVRGGVVYCYAGGEALTDLHEEMCVRLGGTTGVVDSVGGTDADGHDCLCTVKTDAKLPDGIYTAELVTEQKAPISFVLN